MPGGTARLRVSGAIARRFGSVIGPSLKGSNSLVWLMSDMSGVDDDRGELGIAGNSRNPGSHSACADELRPIPARWPAPGKGYVRACVAGFIRNQESRSTGHLQARALVAERRCRRGIGPPWAGAAVDRGIDEAGRDHIAANAFYPAPRPLARHELFRRKSHSPAVQFHDGPCGIDLQQFECQAFATNGAQHLARGLLRAVAEG